MFFRSKPCFPFVFTSSFLSLQFRLITVVTKPFFVLMLNSEDYFLRINLVGRSCPHRIENHSIARFYDVPISFVCKRFAGTILNSCNDLANLWHMMRNYISLKPQMEIVS